jgi:DNA-binding CsgD family transcriptional regulator
MRKPALASKKPPPVAEPAAPVRGLLRRLVKQAGRTDPTPRPKSPDADDVILDVRIDGMHCRIVRPAPAAQEPAVMLSPREREIARMIAKGYPNKTIAAILEISSWTVGTYLRRVFAKLRVGTRAAMVARLMELGLLEK